MGKRWVCEAPVALVAEWLIEHRGFRRNPIQPEGSIANLIKQVQVLDGCVVHTVSRSYAALARAAEDLAYQSIA